MKKEREEHNAAVQAVLVAAVRGLSAERNARFLQGLINTDPTPEQAAALAEVGLSVEAVRQMAREMFGKKE